MSQSTDLLRNAELALAAYTTLSLGATNAQQGDLVTGGMAPKQAEKFVNHYPAVVAYFSDAVPQGGLGTSFSATVFKDAAGHLTLAIRGTAEPGDFVPTDADIALNGMGYDQIVAMYNWWKRVSSPEGEIVQQYRVVGNTAQTAPAVWATGELFDQVVNDPDNRMEVVGHSLGGHLALAFNTLFPEVAGQITVFNAPGFLASLPNHQFFAALGGALPRGANSDNVTNVVADEANIGNAPWSGIAGLHSRPGNAVDIPIENQTSSDEPKPFAPSFNHNQVALTDSLAVFSLLSQLSPTLTTAAYKTILNQAVRGTSGSLEAIVDALERLFGINRTPLQTGNSQRGALYNAIDGLQSNTSLSAVAGQVQISPIDATTLNTKARQDNVEGLAYRYALKELTSFVVTGNSSLYAQHNGNGELALYKSETRAGTLTNEWIADRAAFLGWRGHANGADLDSQLDVASRDNWQYVDRPQGYSVTVFGTAAGAAPAGQRRFAMFGGDGADSLQGGLLADRLYSGIGSDVLQGAGGDDYMEGGTGFDLYQYNATRSLLGTLTNDGADEVRDTDGKGIVRYTYTQTNIGLNTIQSRPIGGVGLKLTGAQWQSPDGKFTYEEQFDGALKVTINGDAGGTIRILDFDFAKARSDGYMGIRLLDAAPSAPPSFVRTFFGDKQDWDSDSNQAGVQTQVDAFDNVVRADGEEGRPHLAQPNREDTFYGSVVDEAEAFLTGGGSDVVYGDGLLSFTSSSGGRDFLEMGPGRDVAVAGAGNDWIEGGPEADILHGNAGDDAIFAGATNGQTLTLGQAITAGETAAFQPGEGELLSGDAGKDVMVGGATRDFLAGGHDADIIVAGGGNDVIYGDHAVAAGAVLGWAMTLETRTADGVKDFVVSTSFSLEGSASVGAADVVYGGAGKDWIFGGAGDDYLEGGRSLNDVNSEDDALFGEAGSDILVGGSGMDFLHGDSTSVDADGLSGDDYLDGGAGDDELLGGKGNDILIGDDGVDILVGGEGDDLIWGGRGNDIVVGGPGKDTYLYHRGDGVDLVQDPDIATGSQYLNELALGPGITRDQVKFRLASLMVDVGDGDAIHFNGFDPDDPLATPVLESIQFADGDVMTYQDVLEQGFDLDGTDGNDEILGTAVTDRIDGKAGNDRLVAKAGDDTIIGGAGRDDIDAGGGDDVVQGGEDADVVDGGAGNDAISGEHGNDLLKGGQGADSVYGGAGEDFIDAGAGDDSVDAGSETDFIQAGAGNDVVNAGDGDDVVRAGDGDDQVFGNAGDDSIEGEAGDDLLAGGAGQDLLVGGGGADTYVYDLGDGNDVISDAGDPDPEVIDRLSFGIGMAEVSLTRVRNGDLLARLADGGTVTVAGMYAFSGGTRLERVDFADGSFLDAAALMALPEGLVLGTEGPDTLVGSRLDETIEGRGGDDLLDGGVGADTLIGGAGHDRYRLGHGTERDTVVEAAGQASTVELEPGLFLDDLRASQSGNDLLLTVRGTANELLVQDYFAASQQITVSDAGGASTTAEELIASAAPVDREALKEDFRIAGRAAFFRNWISSGFTPVDGFTLARHDYPQFHASFSQNFETVTSTFVPASGTATTTVSNNVFTDWTYTFQNGVEHKTAHLDFGLVESDAAAIFAPSTASFHNTPGQEWVQFQWKTTSSQSFTSRRVDVFPFLGGFIRHEYNDTITMGTAVGQTGPVSGSGVPFESSGNVLFPPFKLAGKGDGVHTSTVSEVLAGPGDNEISGAYIVDAGAGDDVVWGAALALGGDGNDVLTGTSLYGEAGDDRLTFINVGDHLPTLLDGGPGNDVLHSGAVMLPGSGDDSMLGDFGDSVFRVGAADFGVKLIWDSGNSESGEDGAPVPSGVDVVELPGPATLDSLFLSWSFLDPLSELGQELGERRRTLDVSWGEETVVRLVRPGQDDGAESGVETIVLGDGTELSFVELLALAPPPPVEPIHGTPFDDQLVGDMGDDILDGGAGDDLLAGGTGSDLYLYRSGDGNDTLAESESDAGDVDTLRLMEIPADDVAVERDEANLYLAIGSTGERITIDSWAADANARIERVEFDDGTVWSDADLQARSVYVGEGVNLVGTDEAETLIGSDGDDQIEGQGGDDVLIGLQGDDSLQGGSGADLLVGGPGDDILEGREGDDVYFYARGDGRDEIGEFDETPGNIDTLRFDPAIAPPDVRVTREYGNAILVLGDGADRVALIGTLDDPANEIERIGFGDGTVWSASDLAARVELLPATDLGDVLWGTEAGDAISGLAGDDKIYGNGGDDILIGGDGNDELTEGEGNNLIEGGAGDDYAYHEGHSIVIGGAGNDWVDNFGADAVIAFNAGDGEDIIYAAESFVLSLGGGLDPADLELSQESDDLILSMGAGGAIRLIRPFGEDWPSITLQMFGSVHTYDFNAVIDRFYAQGPDLALPLGDMLPEHQTSFSETAGLGGAIAWQYATTGNLDALTFAQFQSVLSDPQFGTVPQPISPDSENHVPTTEDDNADVLEDGIFFASGNVLANDGDADAGTTLFVANPGTYMGGYGTLVLEGEGGYHYVLDNASAQVLGDKETASDAFAYQASDGMAQTPGTLAVTVVGANDAPVQAGELSHRDQREGQPFAFTVPSDTFSDVDSGDSLILSASLAGGAAFPGWLSFENGSFSGTPGLADGGEYVILVTATDSAGATAEGDFGLTVSDSLASGNRLVGTRHNDVLNGTASAEFLDGRAGADRLVAGGGDDVLRFFADDRANGRNRSRDFFDGGAGFDTLVATDEHDAVLLDDGKTGPSLAGIERIAAGEGRDLVDLRSTRFSYGDVILDGGEGNDVLRAASGNDVLLGGRGNDELSGGCGQDVYLHGLRGGDDEIHEAGAAGETDVLRFGEGITRQMVRARRHHDDLVLDVSGPHGSVTVKDWFGSAAQRIERIEFADGTAWDENMIRRLVRLKHGDDWHEEEHCSDRGDERRKDTRHEPAAPRNEHRDEHDHTPAALCDRLSQRPRFDFEALLRDLDRSSERGEALSRQDIARQWAAVHRYASSLTAETDDASIFGWQPSPRALGVAGTGFGFEASVGAARGPDSLKSLEGLSEGFTKL